MKRQKSRKIGDIKIIPKGKKNFCRKSAADLEKGIMLTGDAKNE